MSEAEKAYYQNLIDAGCPAQEAEHCIELLREERLAELKRLLAARRRAILERLHADQRQIDCLDYFLYRIQKQK